MRVPSGGELLGRPVLLRGVKLGRAVDVILDGGGERVLGLEVLCGDGLARFLPIAAADPHLDRIDVRSPFALLDGAELAFYRERGTTLTRLRAANGVAAGGPAAA